jgi:histidinol-phosphatase (PHP family)
LVDETVELIKTKELIVEINTRGLYKKRCDGLFPDGYALLKVKEMGIPIILSSDAHQHLELNMLFAETVTKLTDLGFKEVMFFDQGSWQSKLLV